VQTGRRERATKEYQIGTEIGGTEKDGGQGTEKGTETHAAQSLPVPAHETAHETTDERKKIDAATATAIASGQKKGKK
jgi:hypothetical protein